MKIILFKLLILFIIFFLPQNANANENINCSNRFATLINPVRGRNLWHDKSVNPIINQYNQIKQINSPATWLLQYDVLTDQQLIGEIIKFDNNQELGVFLEVSPNFAQASRVIYPPAVPWFSPQAVFFSGYSQSERRRLIDKLFIQFKTKFNYYPKSVGAWWIDSYSLNYMKKKYNIKAAMIVADQKTTDNYGVWGQWWGVPYYPAKANILSPASNLNNKLNVVVIQWAQRDPLLAFGDGPEYSNYSLQANDYIRQKKDTKYFDQLSSMYLDCRNPIGQLTVGLETGIESVGYLNEYKIQLENLQRKSGLEFVTMSEFADRFAAVFPKFPTVSTIANQDSVWMMTLQSRFNERLGEKINYNQAIAFSDFFVKDKANFLDRHLPLENEQGEARWFPWFLLISLSLLFISYKRRLMKVWFSSMLFTLGAYGLILRSYYQMGWKIYFGPELPYLEIVQVVLVLATFGVVWLMGRLSVMRKNVWLLPLVFGIDFLIQSIRVSLISGRYYVGFAVDALRFVGVSLKTFSEINIINQDFPSYISAAFLRVNFSNFLKVPLQALLLYPLAHLILAFGIGVLTVKLPPRLQKILLAMLIILFLLQLGNIFNADPRQVAPILLQ